MNHESRLAELEAFRDKAIPALAKAVAILNGQLAALRKHSDAQAKELADLRSKQAKKVTAKQ